MNGDMQERLRRLPAVDRVVAALGEQEGSPVVTVAARQAVDSARERVRAGEETPPLDEIVADARSILEKTDMSYLQRVVNATGVLIHTNLGRSPLGKKQLEAVARIASGYSNLEFDIADGKRGNRYEHASRLITSLTGAESALVVNNNAGAVLIALAALCAPREVVISRGELVEIGGEFRIPDVLASSGARLVEVGTTNRTHLGDYERAISNDTAAILKVHPSNYRVVGFTASVSARDLARLARGRKVTFIYDLGSGFVDDETSIEWAHGEPTVESALNDGADVVTFSGDKLLGGPQAGVIVGRRDLVDTIARHPLMRALRVDKMTLAALEATVHLYLGGERQALPLWEMSARAPSELEARARALVDQLGDAAGKAGYKIEAIATHAVPGGGSLPDTEIASWGLAVEAPEDSADVVARRLRQASPPVVGRIEDDRVILDLRTVAPQHDAVIATAIGNILTP